MREPGDVFHLAVPARDLDETERFYVAGLGCHLARRYDDRITLDFFGDQLVCHKSDRWERDATDLYPRHFGITFRHQRDWEAVLALARARGLDQWAEPSTRFGGMVEEHRTFVLRDPSNNLIEFKHYLDPRMMH